MRQGDIIQEVDDKPVTRAEWWTEELRSHKVGDKVDFKILREGKTQKIELTLGKAPDAAGPGAGEAGGAFIGLAVEDAVNGGARITQIVRDGPAAKAG